MYNTMLIKEAGQAVCTLESVYLKREVEFEIFFPVEVSDQEELNLLLLNDGQDADGLLLAHTLNNLYKDQKIGPVVAVAIKASPLRLQEYGIAGIPDFKGRGSLAADYTRFILEELLPYLQTETGRFFNGKTAFAGCSLGGLTAFDLVWNHSHVFNAVGVFSGSFWWREKGLDDGYTDADRIMHRVIRQGVYQKGLKFWLMTGTEDEAADRNHNFIIDSIDDTIDIIKELIDKGYNRPNDICYYEMVGGKHHVDSWAKALPAFLTWAFPKTSYL